MNSCSITDNILSRHPLLELLYSPIISAIGNVVDFMVGTFEFICIALGFAASLVEEPAQGAYQPEMMKKRL